MDKLVYEIRRFELMRLDGKPIRVQDLEAFVALLIEYFGFGTACPYVVRDPISRQYLLDELGQNGLVELPQVKGAISHQTVVELQVLAGKIRCELRDVRIPEESKA